MSITRESELIGMQKASEAVAHTLKEMRNYDYKKSQCRLNQHWLF